MRRAPSINRRHGDVEGLIRPVCRPPRARACHPALRNSHIPNRTHNDCRTEKDVASQDFGQDLVVEGTSDNGLFRIECPPPSSCCRLLDTPSSPYIASDVHSAALAAGHSSGILALLRRDTIWLLCSPRCRHPRPTARGGAGRHASAVSGGVPATCVQTPRAATGGTDTTHSAPRAFSTGTSSGAAACSRAATPRTPQRSPRLPSGAPATRRDADG